MPDIKPADYCFSSTIQVSSASERIQGLHELQHKCQDEFVKREVWWQGYAGVADYSDAPLKVRHNAEAWGFNTCNPLLTTQWTHFDLKLKVSENLEILILKRTICIAYWDRWHLVSKVKQLLGGTISKRVNEVTTTDSCLGAYTAVFTHLTSEGWHFYILNACFEVLYNVRWI